MKKNLLLTLFVITSAVALSTTSLARGRGPGFRLGLETSPFSFSRSTVETEDDQSESATTFIGIGGDVSARDPIVSSSLFGIDFGILPTRSLSIGIKLKIGGGRYKTEDESADGGVTVSEWEVFRMSYSFLPYVEYKFDTQTVQPFIAPSVGYAGSTSYNLDNDDYKTRTHTFTYGGEVGIHIFVAKVLSLDFGTGIYGTIGKKVSDNEGSISIDSDATHRSFVLSVNFGLTGWF